MMPKAYNPLRAPDPQAWLALDEMDRIELARRYHQRARVKLPSPEAHAAIHVVVENQAAMGDETPVAAAVERLMGEGLNRHDAIHAVGNVLAQYLWEGSRGEETTPDAYYANFAELTAQSWLRSFEE
jgi:hypothetical protein